MPGALSESGLSGEELAEFRSALEAFQPSSFSDPPPEKKPKVPGEDSAAEFADPRLESLLSAIARLGRTELDWALLRPALLWKLEAVCRHMLSVAAVDPDRLPPKNLHHLEGPEFLQRLLQAARALPGAPFTIQRLAELLTAPRAHYGRWDKFFRALEKTLTVVTTVDAQGFKEAARPAQTPSNSVGDATQLLSDNSETDPVSSSSAAPDGTLLLGQDPTLSFPNAVGVPTRPLSAAADAKEEADNSSPGDLPSMEEGEGAPKPPAASAAPRPNVRISVEPMEKDKEAVEISVEVEDCGEVKDDPMDQADQSADGQETKTDKDEAKEEQPSMDQEEKKEEAKEELKESPKKEPSEAPVPSEDTEEELSNP